MEPKAKAMFILCLLVASVLPLTAHGEQSGGVQASEFTMSLTPQEPVMGGSVDIDVILYNSQQSDAFNVQIAFYKENIASSNRLFFDEVTIPAESTYTASTTWSGLTEGSHKVWFEFSAGGDIEARFNKEFNVSGLANLRIDTLELTTPAPVYSGDAVSLSTLVLNSGSVDAAETKLLVQVPESNDVLLTTPALTAGSSAWVNTTITAPSSGVHLLQVTPDAENAVEEASEMNKMTDIELVVDSSFVPGVANLTRIPKLDFHMFFSDLVSMVNKVVHIRIEVVKVVVAFEWLADRYYIAKHYFLY